MGDVPRAYRGHVVRPIQIDELYRVAVFLSGSFKVMYEFVELLRNAVLGGFLGEFKYPRPFWKVRVVLP